MNLHRLLLPFVVAVLPAPTLAADAEAGLATVRELGTLNGLALACAEARLAARARELMLTHAPKTQRFGAAYEESTNEAFNAQTRAGKPCPETTELTDRANRLALRLAEQLPVAAK